eukprot:s198_g8.t1
MNYRESSKHEYSVCQIEQSTTFIKAFDGLLMELAQLALPSGYGKRGEQKKPNAVTIDAAKQVEEYIKVSKETSSTAYELACIAQDLGSLWSNKYNDDKSLAADQLIEQIVGDRIPFTFGKRGSDTIPSGLQALGQFLSEDPRHYGVRLSALYTGGNYIQERGERNKAAKANSDLEMDSEDSSSDFESAKSSSSDESVNSIGSEEIANFDAQKWHREVDALLAEIQSKDCRTDLFDCGIEMIFEL